MTGTFGTLATQNLPGFLSASLGYSLTNVILNLQSSMASTPGLGGNQIAVARALDTAFNAGPGLGAMPALFGLSQGQMPYALTVLSGSNASVGLSSNIAAGGQFAALMASRTLTRRAAEQTARTRRLRAGTRRRPASPRPTGAPGGQAFGGAQWLNAEAASGAPAAQQTIGGGAFGGDYRAGPQTLFGAAVGLSSSNYLVTATGASGQATGAHFGIYGAV